jgi:UDP-N-acetylmuramoylalanine--D-glutamate ligase
MAGTKNCSKILYYSNNPCDYQFNIIQDQVMDIKGKKISVIGAIRSGTGAAKLIKRQGGIPFVSDSGNSEKVLESVKTLDADKIEYETGSHSDRIYDCGMMVVSPGVPLDSPVVLKAQEKNIKLISEVELASFYFKGKVVAITGTNGKTTTTSLVAHIFNTCGKKTYAAGNIGTAFSEITINSKNDEFAALEVSSFQIDLTDQFKPDVAMLLNITPDHLNRYENSFQKYIESKMRLFRNMDEKNSVILNMDDEVIMNNLPLLKSSVYYFSLNKDVENGCSVDDNKIIFRKKGKVEFEFSTRLLFIKGEHNIANCMAAIIAAKIYGFDNECIAEGLRTFRGVEHRLEFVREIGGVKYINDSKATNVESVWYALRSFEQPVFLILGGQDVGNDYNKIKDLVQENVKKIYAIGSSSDKVFQFLS